MTYLAYRRSLGQDAPRIDGYRRGLALWLPARDVRALIRYRRRGELGVGEWLRSLIRPQRFPVARLDDPLPSLIGAAAWVRRRFRA